MALEFSVTPRFEKRKAQPTAPLSDLVGPVVAIRRALAHILTLAVALEILAIGAPLFNQFIIDGAIVSQDREMMTVLVMSFWLVLVTRTLIDLARSWFLMRWG